MRFFLLVVSDSCLLFARGCFLVLLRRVVFYDRESITTGFFEYFCDFLLLFVSVSCLLFARGRFLVLLRRYYKPRKRALN